MSILQEMGIQQWRLRGRKPVPQAVGVAVAESDVAPALDHDHAHNTGGAIVSEQPQFVSRAPIEIEQRPDVSTKTLADRVADVPAATPSLEPTENETAVAGVPEAAESTPQAPTEDIGNKVLIGASGEDVEGVDAKNQLADDLGVVIPTLRPAPVPLDATPPMDLTIASASEPAPQAGAKSTTEQPPEYSDADIPPHTNEHGYDYEDAVLVSMPKPMPSPGSQDQPNPPAAAQQGVSVEPPKQGADPSAAPGVAELSTLDWRALQALISADQACPSCGQNQSVLGFGDVLADWMFIVDAPTSDEVQAQQLFLDRAGALYEAILEACGLRREQVYTTSVFKCSPPDDMSLSPQCDKVIHRQIELVQPKVVVAFGEFAAQAVLRANEPLATLLATPHRYFGSQISVIPSYTPQQILADPALKAQLWQKLKMVLAPAN